MIWSVLFTVTSVSPAGLGLCGLLLDEQMFPHHKSIYLCYSLYLILTSVIGKFSKILFARMLILLVFLRVPCSCEFILGSPISTHIISNPLILDRILTLRS